MSSLPVASQIEVLDLRHFSARQLRSLLEQEARLWRERLHWDYRGSTELLLQYLESRILQGFVALDRGRICGYSFCVYEGHKAVIGDAFAMHSDGTVDPHATRLLLLHMIEMLQHSPSVERVESQLLLFKSNEFNELFAGPEFGVYPRLFLECDLPVQKANSHERLQLPDDLELTSWAPQDYQPSAELIYACYVGHMDALINDQYKSLHGSLRFLHNIVRFPGCGVFEPNFSWMLRDRRSRTLVGILLSSRVDERVAHVTQLCIAPAQRGRGLGQLLLQQTSDRLLQSGFDSLTLTVTEGNQQAVRLYNRFGFSQRHRFDAMVLRTRPPHR